MEGIMVSAATGVMNSLLTKLTTLLGEEYTLQKNVKRDVSFLKDELSSMNALLEKLAETEMFDPQQKEWRNQVREMAYDIEDSIDNYMHQLHQDSDKSKGIKRFFSGAIKKVKKLAACHEFAVQMRELKTRVVEASQRRDRYKLDSVLDPGSSGVVPIDPRLPALYAEASSLVGTDVPRDELMKLVDDGEKSLKVVSIVGSGGLGKTTLANQVYHKVGKQFDCRAFVSVSQKPDTRKILRSILSQIGKQEYERTDQSGDEEWLINALRDFLKDKRYFIVIDDIWSTQAWKIIKCALLENTCGSRILVTTRIATVFGNIGKLFQLRYLRIEADGDINLPEQIGELQYLETLDLCHTLIRELPASIVKLRRLTRLLGGVELPDGVGNMQALEELSVVVNDESSINSLQELGNLTKLRVLHLFWGIDGSHRADILASSLGKLCSSNLRSLDVEDGSGKIRVVRLDSWSPPPHLLRELRLWGCYLKGIPEWMASLANLLNMSVNQVTQETFQILGDMPGLLSLELQADGPRESLIVCNGGFQRLKYLYLFASIMGPVFEAGAVPKLEVLAFEVSEAQPACGLGIHHLSALRKLDACIYTRTYSMVTNEVEAWKASIKNEASLLPNRPTPSFTS